MQSEFISIKTACKLLGSDDVPLAYDTVWHWMQTGKLTADKRLVRLKSVKLGRRVTTRQWINEFLDDLQPLSAPSGKTRRRRRGKAASDMDVDAVLATFNLS